MMKYPVLIFLLLSTLHALPQSGREVLVDLESYPIPFVPELSLKNTETLELPFFDDFSRGLHFPAPELWDGKHVYVNTTYGINPLTIGVATFDAIDSKGILHSNASTYPFSSDTLTSHPINLNYPNDQTIYLSFLYQPQGYGNQPQTQDSLLLEFYDSENERWVGAWAVSANLSSNLLIEKNKFTGIITTIESDTLERSFMRVHMPINDARFRTSNFRLRFRNIASVSENQHLPGLRSNCDHWHIDMVHLDRNRTNLETTTNDISFYRPIKSILNNYECIPWKHFNSQAQSSELPSPLGFQIYYRNLGPTTWNVTRLFSIRNHSNQQTTNFSGGAINIFGFQDVSYNRSYIYDITSAWADSAKFTYTSYLVTDINPETSHLRWNDTVRYDQNFYNYYAWDDGTAENGYGLMGEGSQNGRVALKFNSYQPDSLVGIYMYFNRTLKDANEKYFKLAVWEDNNGKPGDLLYQQLGVKPIFTDSLNRFTLFKLDESLWIPSGSFYIGWIQTTIDFLNVGFDLNRINNDKLFYNLTGNWANSQTQGSLMIRPVFGSLTEPPTAVEPNVKNINFQIYPNPAQKFITIEVNSNFDEVRVKIFNIIGQQVINLQYNHQPIQVDNLPAGTYIIQLSTSTSIIGTRKLIITR
jgi:hypothetical protein